MSILSRDRSCPVVGFDGDDTLWVDDIDEKRWERDCKRLSVDGLPHPEMTKTFRRRLREFGYTPDGVQRALVESGREVCDGDLPADWTRQIDAIPQCMHWLKLRCPHGLERTLTQLRERGYALWLITKGDLIKQAIKLCCFPHLDPFDMVEIVDRKNAATYAQLLDTNGCAPSSFIMVGDAFWEDVAPVVRLGARAIHVPDDRWALLRLLGRIVPMRRIQVCRNIEDVPDLITWSAGT